MLIERKNLWFSIVLLSFVTACQHSSEQEQPTIKTKKIIKPSLLCGNAAQVPDIWKLEPILVKRGKITPDMSKDEKSKIIRAYIALRSQQYQNCLKGGKK